MLKPRPSKGLKGGRGLDKKTPNTIDCGMTLGQITLPIHIYVDAYAHSLLIKIPYLNQER